MIKKSLIMVVLLMLLTQISAPFIGWWISAFIAMFLAFILGLSKTNAFLIGFTSIFCLWFFQIYWIEGQIDNRLSSRLAGLFMINSSILIMIISSILGALVTGLGGLTGAFLYNARKNGPIVTEKSKEDSHLTLKDLKGLRPEWKDKDHI